MNEREALFQKMVRDFPDSPMGHFSLGRLYLDERRWMDAIKSLQTAVELDGTYAAAWVALGDAFLGTANTIEAKRAWTQALETPLGKRDVSLQADLEQRQRELDDF